MPSAGISPSVGFAQPMFNKATRALLLDEEPAGAIDVLWLQDLCTARTHVQLPWGKSRPHDLIRLVDALAREVICASSVDDRTLRPSADHRELFAKDFAFETAAGQRVVMSLPTRLRRRQWVLARVAHVLRRPPEARTFYSSGQLHRSKGWHRCAIGPTQCSLGSAPKRPNWPAGRTSCAGNSASRRCTLRRAPPTPEAVQPSLNNKPAEAGLRMTSAARGNHAFLRVENPSAAIPAPTSRREPGSGTECAASTTPTFIWNANRWVTPAGEKLLSPATPGPVRSVFVSQATELFGKPGSESSIQYRVLAFSETFCIDTTKSEKVSNITEDAGARHESDNKAWALLLPCVLIVFKLSESFPQ